VGYFEYDSETLLLIIETCGSGMALQKHPLSNHWTSSNDLARDDSCLHYPDFSIYDLREV
jgi:hypothetical protein